MTGRIHRVLITALAVGGCVNEDLHYYEVELTGTITTADPQLAGVGEVMLELHHERVGQGMFERPLGLVERWSLATGEREFTGTALVSQDDGAEGLVMYGWLDLDGDGTLCSPDGNRNEPAGIVVIDEYPAHELSFTLELAEPCRGAEGLYP
jgi:hypothetical protein